MPTKTQFLGARDDTTTAAPSATNCSENNTCLNGGLGNNSLLIILCSWYLRPLSCEQITDSIFSIPIFIAVVVLFFIHRAHIKRVRREEKNDKDFDMDFGVGELPTPVAGTQINDTTALGGKQDPNMPGSSAFMKGTDLQSAPGTAPYLVPK